MCLSASLTCEEELEISAIAASLVALKANDIQRWHISKQILPIEDKLPAAFAMKHWLATFDDPCRKPFSIPQMRLAFMLVRLPVSGLTCFAAVLYINRLALSRSRQEKS
jgi:hypothetical protein